jgi:hypothetical protein
MANLLQRPTLDNGPSKGNARQSISLADTIGEGKQKGSYENWFKE